MLSLQERLHQALFASRLPPTLAAFAYALANVLLFWALAWWRRSPEHDETPTSEGNPQSRR